MSYFTCKIQWVVLLHSIKGTKQVDTNIKFYKVQLSIKTVNSIS